MAHHFFNTASVETLILLTPKTVLIVDMPYETHDNCFFKHTRGDGEKCTSSAQSLFLFRLTRLEMEI